MIQKSTIAQFFCLVLSATKQRVTIISSENIGKEEMKIMICNTSIAYQKGILMKLLIFSRAKLIPRF